MDTSISLHDLFDHIEKEFSVDEQGLGFISRRGIARLSSASLPAVQKILKKIKEGDNQKLHFLFQPFTGQDFEGDNQIPDLLAGAIIQYYAYQGRELAQKVSAAIVGVGLRTVIQKSLGWDNPMASAHDIVMRLVQEDPTPWEPRFNKEYYEHLSRLTGLKQQGHKRPRRWAQLTKELVYDYLPAGVYEQIKAWQQTKSSTKKIHQFLSPDGLTVLEKHRKLLFALMSATSSLDDLKQLVGQSCTQQYQLKLLS